MAVYVRQGQRQFGKVEGRAVPHGLVDAIQPFVSRQVWAIVQLQRLTGARAGELTRMRPCDVDRTGEVWGFSLGEHKTAWHGHKHHVFVGPKAQEVLAPFLLRDPQAFCFSPTEARDEWRRQAFENRTTALSCGNSPGTNRKNNRKWAPGERYTTDSYRIAIRRACDRAFAPPAPLAREDGETVAAWRKRLTKEQKAELRAWRKGHRWHPHQLHHTYGTRVRKDFGLEEAQILLGHQKADVTQIYAERDMRKAAAVAVKIG